MAKDFIEQLKEFSPTLHQIHIFIMDAAKLGYGEIEFVVKTHDFASKIVEMKAVSPEKESLPRSITKRIMVGKGGK